MSTAETTTPELPQVLGPVWIRLHEGDGTGRYAWTAAVPAGDGHWLDGEPLGTLEEWPAYEANRNPRIEAGTAVVLATVYRQLGELRFVFPCGIEAFTPVPPVDGPAVVGDMAEDERFPVRIAEGNGSGMYSWREQVPVASGGWVDGEHQGTLDDFPAHELNSNPRIPSGVVVNAHADPANRILHFQAGGGI